MGTLIKTTKGQNVLNMVIISNALWMWVDH